MPASTSPTGLRFNSWMTHHANSSQNKIRAPDFSVDNGDGEEAERKDNADAPKSLTESLPEPQSKESEEAPSQDYVYSDDQDIDLLVVLRVAADSAEVEDWRAIRRLLMDKCPQPPICFLHWPHIPTPDDPQPDTTDILLMFRTNDFANKYLNTFNKFKKVFGVAWSQSSVAQYHQLKKAINETGKSLYGDKWTMPDKVNYGQIVDHASAILNQEYEKLSVKDDEDELDLQGTRGYLELPPNSGTDLTVGVVEKMESVRAKAARLWKKVSCCGYGWRRCARCVKRRELWV